MIDDIKEAKLKKFFNDQGLTDSVFEKLQDYFLSKKGTREVAMLAAERLVLEYLREAKRDLGSRYRLSETGNSPPLNQVGM